MKRTISISLHIKKCWDCTTDELRLARHLFSPRRPDRDQAPGGTYDIYAFAIIKMFRRTEESIRKYNKFDRVLYSQGIKKLIEEIKSNII